MKLLIDTNIVLDALMNREPWAKAAQGVILAIAEEKAEGYVTASSFTDIHYLLRFPNLSVHSIPSPYKQSTVSGGRSPCLQPA